MPTDETALVPILEPETDEQRIFGKVKTKERVAKAERIGTMKIAGRKLTDIAKELDSNTIEVNRIYKQFLQLHKSEWLQSKGATVAEINLTFQKSIQDIRENYLKCKEINAMGGMALWVKLMNETLKNYVEFLQKLGYVHQGTYLEIDDSIKRDEKEPILIIQNVFMKYLKEKTLGENGRSTAIGSE